MPDLTLWKIDECAVYHDRLHVCGWCHVPGGVITRLEIVFDDHVSFPAGTFGLSSPDVDRVYGPGAGNVRFDEWITIPHGFAGKPFYVRCSLADGRTFYGRDALTNAAWGDPYFQSWENFVRLLGQLPSGTVLELGSRARSAVTRRHRIPEQLNYVGVDVMAGPNVDVVADAHELAGVLGEETFVAAFSTSVFEHLAMPWKVVLELNRVLVCGGLVYTATHQTFPLHDEPWDFWRYSQHTWPCLFNPATGFEVLETAVGEPARVHPCRTTELTRDLPLNPAWLGSACIAKKISGTALTWPVSMATVATTTYPSGSLSARATNDPV